MGIIITLKPPVVSSPVAIYLPDLHMDKQVMGFEWPRRTCCFFVCKFLMTTSFPTGYTT